MQNFILKVLLYAYIYIYIYIECNIINIYMILKIILDRSGMRNPYSTIDCNFLCRIRMIHSAFVSGVMLLLVWILLSWA